MKLIVTFAFILLTFCGFSQEIDCSDFKEGNFTLLPPKQIVESGNVTVYRKGNVQIETHEKTGKKVYEKIEWLSNNSYIITFDENMMELDDVMKYVNSKGGLLVTITNREGDCVNYEAHIKNEIQGPVMEAAMCKKK